MRCVKLKGIMHLPLPGQDPVRPPAPPEALNVAFPLRGQGEP